MKKLSTFAAGLALSLFVALPQSAEAQSYQTKWHWNEGTIEVESPARPAGQKDVLNLALPAEPVVRVAFVGLGMRGPGAVERFTHINGVRIVALCDYEPNRVEACQKILKNAGLPEAASYSGAKGYEDLCKRPDINLVYVATDWDHHFPVAKCALENGKNTAIEVPSALNLQQCWDLINLAEQKQLHCMILENCCYDWYEMNALNMAQHGVFGEVLRAEGAYIHNLDSFWDYYWKNPDGSDPDKLGWRMKYNKEYRGDLYATHGLGPVAQALDIHRGDRFTTLVAMDTKSSHGKAYVEKKTGRPCNDFRSGDHTTTLMRTENGKVVEIQHNVMTPQPYNRLYKLTGTKGYATKYPEPRFALDASTLKDAGVPAVDNLNSHDFMPADQQAKLEAKYMHPILAKYGAMAKEVGGHGGMDFIMDSRLVYCMQNGLPLDMDVYDLAEWCCLGELGALSMDHNCASVAFPDFTRGNWDRQKGFKHAYATPEQEKQSAAIAEAYTQTLKTKGADAAEKELKKMLKKLGTAKK